VTSCSIARLWIAVDGKLRPHAIAPALTMHKELTSTSQPPSGSQASTGGDMPPHLRIFNPPSISKPTGYSHVVEVTGPSRTVYIAGQLGLDAAGRLAGPPGDFRAQALQTYENLKAALAAVGAGFEHVVKFNNYLTDVAAQLPIFREVRDRYVRTEPPPASTTVQIARLAREGAVVEIEAIAVLPL
jgi:enamine deaminase RidA (YjgF/YER057c/UK114 family)